MPAAVNAGTYLHHLQLESSDPERLAQFYAQAMDMNAHAIGGGGWLCEGPMRRVLVAPGESRRLGFAGFGVRDADSLEMMRETAERGGLEVMESPSPLFQAGAFAVRDPDGNTVVFGLGQEGAQRRGLRGPLQHLTLATRDIRPIEAFYVGKLGFMVSDIVRSDEGEVNTLFTRSNHEHHTLACFRHPDRVGMDHHSYEAGDWSVIKEWCDRMGEMRIPIMWGPGRHGPGNNIFIFVEDPDKNWIEISAELEVMYDRAPKEWRHEERTLNSWGRAIMRI